jgi:hypothetical protein
MMICSGVFVAGTLCALAAARHDDVLTRMDGHTGLPFEVVFDEDCDIACFAVNSTVDYTERSVTSVLLNTGEWPVKSIWRGDGIGCTVVDGITEAELRAQNIGDQRPLPALNATTLWPLGEALAPRDPSVDWAAIEASVEADFACERCNTRAVTISYKGQLVYERYRTETGVSASTRLIGWSATKTVTNAFVGVLVNEGRLNVDQRMPVPEWNVEAGDPRAAVTVKQMLHMASGQLWREASGDVRCLFITAEGNCAGYYANQRTSPVHARSPLSLTVGGTTQPRRWRRVRATSTRPAALLWCVHGPCMDGRARSANLSYAWGVPADAHGAAAARRARADQL